MKGSQKMRILKMLSLVLVCALALGIGVTATMQQGGNKSANVVSLDTQTALGGASVSGGKVVIDSTDDSGKQLIGPKENVISSPVTQEKFPLLLKTDAETGSSTPTFSPDFLTNVVLRFARHAGARIFMLSSAVLSGSDAVAAKPSAEDSTAKETVAPKISASDAASKKISASDASASSKVSASDAGNEDVLLNASSQPEALAEGDPDVSFTVTQSYADSVEDKPTSYGQITLETYGSRITPEDATSAVQQYVTTSASSGGTIASGAQMSNLKILSYDRKYPISNVQVFVNGADVTSEIGSFTNKTTDSYGKSYWIYTFNSRFGFADGSDVAFKIEYGSWEKYTLSQKYSSSIPAEDRPSTYGSIYVLSSSGILCDDTTTTNNVTLTSAEQSETGYIEPNLKLNYIEVTPPSYSHYYIKDVRIFVDNVDVTDTAIKSATTPAEGKWKLTFNSDYTIPAKSTLQVEAVYDNWKTYELRQSYDNSVDSAPSILGTLTVYGDQVFLPDGIKTLEFQTSIGNTESKKTGLIKPDAGLGRIHITPPTNYSVRELHVYIDGELADNEALDYERSATITPSTGIWTVYFKSNYKVPAGSTLEVEVKYGGWKTYELRQSYDGSVDPAPSILGTLTVYGDPVFLPDGIKTLESQASIGNTESKETGLIKPDAALSRIHITPPTNYSVRELHVYIDGELADDEALDYERSATITPSTGIWTVYFKSGYKVPDGSTLEVEVKYGGWKTYEIRQSYDDSVTNVPSVLGTLTVLGESVFLPDGIKTLESQASIGNTESKETGLIKPDAALSRIHITPPPNYSVRELHVYIDGKLVDDEALDYERPATITPSTGSWTVYFKSGYKVPDGSTLEVEVKYGGWKTYEIRQAYSSSVDPVPNVLGTLTVYGDQVFIPDGLSTLEYQASIGNTESKETGLIKPDAGLGRIHITPPPNYSVRSVHVYVDGQLVDDEALDYERSATITPSTGSWTVYFKANYTVPDGSTLIVEAEYGDWESYEIRQAYSSSVDPVPDVLGTLTVYGDPVFIPNGLSTLEYQASIGNTESEETGLIKPDARLGRIHITPPPNYSVRSVHVYVDGQLVDDEALDYDHSATITPSTGSWTIYFKANYTVPDGSTLEVEAEYGDWESYEIRQAYSSSVDPVPDVLGTLTVYGDQVFIPNGLSTLEYQASIGNTESEETGLIKPDARLGRIHITPPPNYSVRSVHVYVDGQLVDDEALDYERSATITPSSGSWTVYFKANYTIPDGSTLEVEAEYGDWESYELRQAYSSAITPAPNVLGTLTIYGDRVFIPDGLSTLEYQASIGNTESEETGLIKPDAHLGRIHVTPPPNYSVRSVHVYVDGQLVDDEALDYERSATITPSSGNWTVYFKANYTIPDGSTLEVEAEYGDWESYELRQAYSSAITPAPNVLGTLTVYGDRVFIPDGLSTLEYQASIGNTESEETGLIKPDAHLGRIHVTPPPNYSVRSVHVYVDGQLVDDEALDYERSATITPSSGSWTVYFKANYTIPDGSTLIVEAEYGDWESYELRQQYADSVDPVPNILGTLTVYGDRVFIPDGLSTLEYQASIGNTESEETGLIKPDAHLGRIHVTPPPNYSVRSVHVYVDGQLVDDEALDYERSATITPSTGNWTVYFKANYTIPDGSTLIVEAEYGDWESYELRQQYADSVDPVPSILGTLTIHGERVFIPDGLSTLEYQASIGNTESEETGLIKPDARLGRIHVTPPPNYSVRSVHVYVDGQLVDDEALDYERSATITPSTGSWTVYFKANYTIPDGSTLIVEAEYGDWESYELRQQYADSVDPVPNILGTLTVYGERVFIPDGLSTLEYQASIGNTESEETGLIKPDAGLSRIYVTPPTGYSVVGVDVYIDGELAEDAINYQHNSTNTPNTGNWTLYFASNYKIPAGSKLEVVATYGEWCDFTVTQKYAHTIDPIPSEYGAVSVYGKKNGTFFIDGTLASKLDVSKTESEVTEKLRPDYELNYITAIPQTNYSVLSIDVYVDGSLQENAIDFTRTGSLTPSTGMWRLYFNSGFSVPSGSEIEVVVTYGDWFDITLKQENLLQGDLGKMSVKADRYNGFVSDSSYAGNFELSSAESDTRLIHPDATISDLVVTPPTGLSILEATATITKDNITTEWLVDGKSAVTLNDDGTVSLTSATPDGDIVIEVKYGARLYIRSNIDDVVTVDSVAATTEFAKLSDITSSNVALDILAKDGWKITSVSYGTNEATQNTIILGSNSEYSISSIASDIYVNVDVERADRKLSARMDGTGTADIIYGGAATALTGSAQVIDDAVQIGSEVTFEVAAGTDTEILDVTLNGKSLGNVRKFTMPDIDSEIVVYTELKQTKLLKIEALLTGDGEAEASYIDTVVTLEKTARVIAADVESGTYDITFSPLEGSEIISVSIDGTKLTPKGGSGEVYSITVADEDVLVTVETRKIPSYNIYAKANIADAAKFGDTALTTDYEIVAAEYENSNVSLELIAESGYEVVEVKGGDKVDSLTAIEPTDGKYTFDSLSCDKYVEVTLAKQPTITVKRTGDGVVYTAGVNVDISNTSYLVKYGSDHDFTFIPLEGAELVKVTVTRGENDPVVVYDPANGIRLTRNARSLDESKRFDYTLGNVTEDCVIEAVFTNQPEFEMHVIKTGEGEGTFDYDGTIYTDSFDTTVTYGSEPSLTIKAKAGSKIISVKVGDSEETAEKIDFSGSKLTLPEVTEDVYVVVEFEKLPSSGDTPKTGDTIATVTINLFVISGLVCAVYMINRRKQFTEA